MRGVQEQRIGTKLPRLMNCWKRITLSMPRESLQAVATEMYKISNNMSHVILKDIFEPQATYPLQCT